MPSAPGPLTPTKTPTVNGLYTEQFLPTGAPVGVVVVSHGYAEHGGRYREVAHVMVDAGWAVLVYDVRGHGKSVGARGFIGTFDEYLVDLRMMIAESKALAPGKPVVLLGHSHGSLITLRLLVEGTPDGVVGAIVSSPYLGLKLAVPGYMKFAARVASRIAPGLKQPNNIKSSQLTSDPAKQAEHAADKLNFDTATSRWYTESSRAQAEVAQRAASITVPTTWLVGANDPLADPATSRRIADSMQRATYHDLTGLLHEVFNEATRAEVFELLRQALATYRSAS